MKFKKLKFKGFYIFEPKTFFDKKEILEGIFAKKAFQNTILKLC